MSNGKIDPECGREPLLGSYTGQILQPYSYPSNPPKLPFQNHAVVYYNDVAAAKLGQIWRDPFKPDISDPQFPEGSMVVKVEAVTLTDKQWPVLENSSVSYIYRPSVASLANPDPTQRPPVITPMRFLQMAVRVKDKVASPDTGWVFIAFAYDARSTGATVWDRAIPVGAMWGNDPALARYPNGLGLNGELQETWVAEGLPRVHLLEEHFAPGLLALAGVLCASEKLIWALPQQPASSMQEARTCSDLPWVSLCSGGAVSEGLGDLTCGRLDFAKLLLRWFLGDELNRVHDGY